MERLTIGDHTLFVGDVDAYRSEEGGTVPLVRYRRRYAAMGDVLSAEAPEGYPT